MSYKYVATTAEGFVKQLVLYLHHGYWFYVTGRVKPGKDPLRVDGTILSKFGVPMSRQQRWRRKKRGLANVHYLRFEDFWILVCTRGKHRFFDEHVIRDRAGRIVRKFFRDARKNPVLFAGYSLSVKRGKWKPYRLRADRWGPPERDDKFRVRVQISRRRYQELCAEFTELAKQSRWSAAALESMVYRIAFEPYAPIKQQLHDLVRRMNRARRQAGLRGTLSSKRAVRYWMEPRSAFQPVENADVIVAREEIGVSATAL